MESQNDPRELREQVTRLTEQVAALQHQLGQLQQFLCVETRPDLEGAPSFLTLRCASVSLCNPQNPTQTQGLLAGSNTGASFSLSGIDGKDRIMLSAQHDLPRCTLFAADLKEAVELSLDPGSGRGLISVSDAGKPRTLMKASDIGGVISVVHDDGRPRALLFGNAAHGEILALGADTPATVKISCDKSHGGGLVTVSANDSKPAVALSASHEGGAVMVLRKEGSVGCSMATMDKVSGITVSSLGQGQLHFLSDTNGPSVRLTDSEGHPRLSLQNTADGSLITIDSTNGQPLVSLASVAGQPAINLDNGQGDRITLQTAPEGGGMLAFSNPPDQPQLLLLNARTGPSIALRPHADRGAAATLGCTREGGALFICDSEGTRRCGLCATEDGSQLMLFNDLGIERVLLGSAQDGGALKLNWGGTMGVAALATQEGGAVVVNDANGRPRASLPPHDG
jgi:hypothetical protein